MVDDAIDRVMSAPMQRAEITGDAAARADQVADILQSVGRRLVELDPATLVAAIERRIAGR